MILQLTLIHFNDYDLFLPGYDQGCIKEAFSKEIGCRMKWDEHTDKNIPICSSMTQFRCFLSSNIYMNVPSYPFSSELQKKYFIVSKMVQLQVSDMTGKRIYIYNISYEDFCPKFLT